MPFDALQVTGRPIARSLYKRYTCEVTVEDAPSHEEAFDLEREIAERFTQPDMKSATSLSCRPASRCQYELRLHQQSLF